MSITHEDLREQENYRQDKNKKRDSPGFLNTFLLLRRDCAPQRIQND
jgi:hypothetical protein